MPTYDESVRRILDTAFSAIGVPYVWGGNSLATGVDCSGLVQQAFRAAGIEVPRVSAAIARVGQAVDFAALQPGDVIYYNTGTRNDAAYGAGAAEHVAIYIGNGKMIEAYSRGHPIRVTNVRAGGQATRIVGSVAQGAFQNVTLGPSGQRWDPQVISFGAPAGAPGGGYGDPGTAGAASPTSTVQGVNGPQPGETPEQYARRVYGYLGWFLEHPEIGDIIRNAATEGWDQSRLLGALYETEWWRTTSETARIWDAELASDPANTERKVRARVAEIEDLIGQLGINVDPNKVYEVAVNTLRFGIDPASAEFQNTLASLLPQYSPTAQAGTGDFAATLDEIKRLANAEYMVGIADADAWTMAQRVIARELTMDGVKLTLLNAARGRFTQLGDVFDQGVTPGQFFAPYRNAIATELEMSADQIDLLDPRWSQVISTTGSDGKPRVMTLSETLRFTRKQPEWERTDRARATAASTARDLLVSMGAARF